VLAKDGIMHPIQTYTKTLLAPRLKNYGLNKDDRAKVCADVEIRLASLLSHWRDESFRRTVLTLATEVATFWEPIEASVEVRAVVFLCVRNSQIEALNVRMRGRKQVLLDEDMPQLTGEAIEFFRSVELAHPPVSPRDDVFGELSERFPNAWECLAILASLKGGETEHALQLKKAEAVRTSAVLSGGRIKQVTGNGMDGQIDPQLARLLHLVATGELTVFYSPSFHRVTRNAAKLLGVLDHLLRHGAAFLTHNYVLSSTYVSRRVPLLSPAHTSVEAQAQLTNVEGLAQQHKEMLEVILAEATNQVGQSHHCRG
jgi:hypothetical protein